LRGTSIHVSGNMASYLSRFYPEYHSIRDKHVRGCVERSIGSEVEGWIRPVWRSETRNYEKNV
jgi:hypothetical protein